MAELAKILNTLEPISLEEMDRVKLMNRTDTKFIFRSDLLPSLLTKAATHYQILIADNECVAKYNTLYYDTDSDEMFTAHQNGRLNRYKIRQRSYVHSGLTFIEVKHKTNKGRTIKKRIKRKKFKSEFPKKAIPFIPEYSPFTVDDLIPRMHTRFSRITLVHKTDMERITLDFNLEFDDAKENVVPTPFLAIAEVKQDGFSGDSDFISILNEFRIKPSGMSKYCIGSLLVRDGLKYNRFKRKLLTLKKMSNDDELAKHYTER